MEENGRRFLVAAMYGPGDGDEAAFTRLHITVVGANV